MKWLHTKSFYFRIFAALIVVVFLPISVLGFVFYQNSVHSMESRLTEQYELQLESIGKNLADTILTIENDLYSFRTNSIFYEFVRTSEVRQPLDKMTELSAVLENFKIKYDVVQSIYLYNPEQQVIVTNNQGSFDLQSFYDTAWIDEFDTQGDVKRYNIRQNINEEIRSTTRTLGDIQNVYTIVLKLNMDQLLAINISMERLEKQISSSYAFWPGSMVFVYNDTDSLVMGDVDQLDQLDDSLHFESDVPYNGWQITVAVPRSALLEGFEYFRDYIISICVLVVLACVFFSVVLSRIVYRPINHLMKEVGQFSARPLKESSSHNEITYVKTVLDHFNAENELLHGKVSLFDSLTRNTLIRDFLQGKIFWEEFVSTAEKIGLVLPALSFRLVMLESLLASDPGRQSAEDRLHNTVARLNRVEVLHTYLNQIGQGIVMEHSTDRILILLQDSASRSGDLAAIQQQIIAVARETFGIGRYIGVSGTTTELQSGPHAYEDCQAAYNYAVFFDLSERIISEADIVSLKENPPKVPLNIEAGLIRSILLQDKLSDERLIQELSQYLRQNQLEGGARQSVTLLLSSLEHEFSFTGQIGDKIYTDIRDAGQMIEIERLLLETSISISAFLNAKSDHENHYVREAKRYLKENYHRDIGVSDVADHLNISYSYLFKLFKDHTKTNILEYLHEIRIDQAKSQLLDSDKSIATIAQSVGYNNIQTFQRLFKKNVGVTPGEFRKMHASSANRTFSVHE